MVKHVLAKLWHFIWEEDSIESWIVNIILAFVIVKFLIYPGLGFLLGTSYPVVAVVSGSMEHDNIPFDSWWEQNNGWYVSNNFSKEQFISFPNGFNTGDIMVLKWREPKDIKEGTVIVYSTERHVYPIIHRVTKKWVNDGEYFFQTKGDHNTGQDPEDISEKKVLGNAIFKIPMLGWIKIWFTESIRSAKNVILS
ncbi:signal peptidase I [Candidatus Woesearchaeota archaeon]|nr:signal peptidase I [Candidatus Woesearchaeota archaeon]